MSPSATISQPSPARDSAGRLDWLDGLRAIAILGVVMVHAATLIYGRSPLVTELAQIGQYGVQLFFVISTITIMLTLSKQPNTTEWYIKRFFRIAPLYYLAIAVYHPIFVVENALGDRGNSGLALTDILANIFFVHGWVPSAINTTVPGGWSIAVEMTFYLIAPPLVALLRRFSRTTVLVVTVALCVILLACSIGLSGGSPHNNTFKYFWPINQMPIFLIGIGLFIFFKEKILAMTAKANYATLALGALALGAGFYVGTVGEINHAIAPTLIALSVWIILLSLGSAKKALAWPPLTFIGRISFSIYIVHFFFVDLFHFAISKVHLPQDPTGGFIWLLLLLVVIFSLSAVSAAISRRLVELPSIHLGERLIAWRRTRRERQALTE